jgi:hypothetical protein
MDSGAMPLNNCKAIVRRVYGTLIPKFITFNFSNFILLLSQHVMRGMLIYNKGSCYIFTRSILDMKFEMLGCYAKMTLMESLGRLYFEAL